MLVLTRKIGELIYIGDDIKVTVLDIDSRGQARIGVEAPKTVPVHREEIYLKIKHKDQYGEGVYGAK